MSEIGAELAVILGVAAFVVVYVTAVNLTQRLEAGILPAVIAAIWAGWPMLYKYAVAHSNLLNPLPKQYNLNCQQVLVSIKNVLSDLRYSHGHDKWQVKPDVEANEIEAELRFMHDTGGDKPKRQRRWIKLEVYLTPEGNTTRARYVFQKDAQDATFTSWCDPIINEVMREIEGAIGPSKELGEPEATKVPPAPMWLKMATVAVAILLLFDIVKAIGGAIFRSATTPSVVVERSNRKKRQEQKQGADDLWQWLNRFVQP